MKAGVDDLLDVLGDSRDPELRRVVASAGVDDHPPVPDPDVMEPYRWFVHRVGDGVRLTAAGYLPPALVAETMQTLGWDSDWFGAGNREDMTRPVAELRDTARRLGLVRVQRSMLTPTKDGRRLAADPVGLWWHVAARLPLARRDPERVAGLLWLLAVAAGRPGAENTVARGLALLGWVDSRTGRPLDDRAAFGVVRDSTWTVFRRLGLLGTPRNRAEVPTPSAVALARAALLIDEPAARAKTVPSIELTVTLRDVDPPVWRRLVVPEDLTLHDLVELLQAGMGWRGRHLSMVELAGRSYGDVEDMDELGDPRVVRLGSLTEGTLFRWDYDFGDGWEHDVRVEGRRTAEAPTCLDGGGACPPEDSGGPAGYERLRQVLADPRHPEHADALAWSRGSIDPERFDDAEATRRMRTRRPRP
ncbi:MAG: plasmid pRiA4b ORF-3 family protein [Blastococcus sp.]|nr:plasmid pRiA4b ORF-3 family protein [Blastococcus sp.]